MISDIKDSYRVRNSYSKSTNKFSEPPLPPVVEEVRPWGAGTSSVTLRMGSNNCLCTADYDGSSKSQSRFTVFALADRFSAGFTDVRIYHII